MAVPSVRARWRDALPRPSLAARVLWAVALCCALLLGVDGWRTWQRREALIAGDMVDTANLARSLSQHAHDLVRTADTAVMGLRDAVEADGLGPRTLGRLDRLLAAEVEGTPALHGLYVFDAAGTYVASPSPLPSPAPNGSDREYFRYHRAHRGRDVLLGPPVHSRLDGTWILTVSRRIDAPDGSFGGVALATISIDALQRFYASFDVGPHGAIALESTDSRLLARSPADPARIGADLSGGPLAERLRDGARMGGFDFTSRVDGTQRLGSFRLVDGFPLVVLVAHGSDDVLAPWWADAATHGAVTLAAAIVVLMGLRLARRVREGQARADATADSERHYRLLATYSTDMISLLGPDLRRTYVSPSCEAMLGYDPRELVGRHCTDMLSAEDQAVFTASLAVARAEGQAPPATYQVRRKDGTAIWVETIGRSMPDGQGYVMATRDVTQRLLTEARLREATGALGRMAAVADLVRGMHEPCERPTREATGD